VFKPTKHVATSDKMNIRSYQHIIY